MKTSIAIMYTHSRERRFFDMYEGEEGIVNNDLRADQTRI
jgi:hypothetical protein